MKRTALLSHLRDFGCRLEREGASHSIWLNPLTGKIQAIPRHTEIKKFTVRAICQKLGVPVPKGA